MEYRILDRSQLDLERWNNTIMETPYAPPYALSWYLDAASGHQWKALVRENYQQVMPLPYKQRLGLKQIYQPPLSQQLGIYGTDLKNEDVSAFLHRIPKHFQPIAIPMNARFEPIEIEGWQCTQRDNFILNLNQPYANLRTQYSQGFRSHINKNEPKLKVEAFDNVEELDTHFAELVGRRVGIKEKQLQISKNILQTAFQRNHAFMIQVLSPENEWAAQLYFLRTKNRIIKLRAVANKKGRKYCANHVGIDHVIKTYANQDIVFDFEGSSIPGVAAFFKGFGSVSEPFYLYEKEGFANRFYKLWRSFKN